MLFHSSIRKELAHSFGATLVVLATIVVTMMLIRTLGQASRGSVNPSDVMLLMAYTVLGQLPIILGLSLFVAIVGTLSRMYRDSEMVIWFASGRGLMGFMKPLLRFAWPVLLAIAALSLLAWPWANLKIQYLRQQYESRGDIDRVTPGQFQESANGNRVFFIDKESIDNKTGNNIFIASSENDKESITAALNARIETINNDRYILLTNGQRQDRSTSNPETKLSEFLEYGTKIKNNSSYDQQTASAKTISTYDLLNNPTPTNIAELSWRSGLAIAAFNFVVLGLALSSVTPRTGRTLNLVFGLLSLIVYYNLMTLGQTWIASKAITLSPLMLALHGGTLALSLLLLAKRHYNWIFFDLFKKYNIQRGTPKQ